MEQPVLVFGNPHSKESFFLHSYGISSISICARCLLSFRWALQRRVSLCLLYPLPSLSPAVVALSAFPSVSDAPSSSSSELLIYPSEWILCWTHSSMSMSFLHWGAQHWLQPHQEWEEKDHPPWSADIILPSAAQDAVGPFCHEGTRKNHNSNVIPTLDNFNGTTRFF